MISNHLCGLMLDDHIYVCVCSMMFGNGLEWLVSNHGYDGPSTGWLTMVGNFQSKGPQRWISHDTWLDCGELHASSWLDMKLYEHNQCKSVLDLLLANDDE